MVVAAVDVVVVEEVRLVVVLEVLGGLGTKDVLVVDRDKHEVAAFAVTVLVLVLVLEVGPGVGLVHIYGIDVEAVVDHRAYSVVQAQAQDGHT